MNQLTEQQYNSLISGIFDKLCENPEISMGELGETRDEAKRIVFEWAESNNIKLPTND